MKNEFDFGEFGDEENMNEEMKRKIKARNA